MDADLLSIIKRTETALRDITYLKVSAERHGDTDALLKCVIVAEDIREVLGKLDKVLARNKKYVDDMKSKVLDLVKGDESPP
jgi:hypothetical protein